MLFLNFSNRLCSFSCVACSIKLRPSSGFLREVVGDNVDPAFMNCDLALINTIVSFKSFVVTHTPFGILLEEAFTGLLLCGYNMFDSALLSKL